MRNKGNKMNIDHLAIVQVKELTSSMLAPKNKNLMSEYIGKYVIVRSYNEGINAGLVLDANETGIVLFEARRLHYHIPLDETVSWYEGVAKSGLGNDCKVSAPATKIIIENYSVTVCTDTAMLSITGYKSHAQA